MKFLPSQTKIFFGKSPVIINWFLFIIFSFNNFFAFWGSVIKKTFFDLLMINLEFGTGLFGPSAPLIFKIQATFSGAVINKLSALFFLNNLQFY